MTSPDLYPLHEGIAPPGLDTGGLPALSPETFALERPDAHLVARGEDGTPAARCSLWWREAPAYPGHRIGLVGHYAARGGPAAQRLLEHAGTVLRAHGCTLAVGPMDGATWRGYRFVTRRGPHPPFFLEPDHPAHYPHQFVQAGFAPLAHYGSSCAPDLTRLAVDAPPVHRVHGPAVRLRPLAPERLEEEIRTLYALTTASFTGNPLYTRPPFEPFRAQYLALRPHVRPELVLLAEQAGEAVGFCFLVPDMLRPARGLPDDTVIFKTLAVHPALKGQGVGGWLVAHAHAAARALGYRRSIYALMHEANASGRISAHYGRPFRRYTLFAKPLT